MEFDAARVAVLAGDHGDVVARFPGVVCVARCPEPDLLRRFLRLCAEASGPDPGRPLARSLARWLAGEEDLPDRIVLGTVSTAGDQTAVFLSGAVAVEIGEVVLSGTDAAAWTDRLLPASDGPVRLALHGATGRSVSLLDVLDLRAGVVPGAGVVVLAGPSAMPRPPAVEVPSVHQPSPQHEPRWAPQPERSPLAPDQPSSPRPTGNGVALPAEAGSPSVAPTPAPERPDQPGSDEEFTSGEWFGATGRPEPTAADSAPDARSSWVASPSSSPPSAAGRHAVHSPVEPPAAPPFENQRFENQPFESRSYEGEPTEAASFDAPPAAPQAEPDAEPPTPRDGSDAMVAATVGAAPEPRVVELEPTQATAAPWVGERDTYGPQPVPAPRAAPTEQSDDPVAAGKTAHRNGDTPASAGDPPQAQGRQCPRGHLNDPRSQFCSHCGARINDRAALVVGVRPALGKLVFDDGASYTVDAEYLVGRMPESDQRVTDEELRAIVVEDRSGAVSRVHAEIRIDGWDVLLADSGSRNGTFVAGPTQQGWSPLPPGTSRRLVPGTRVRMGGRTFVFESPGGGH